MEKPKFNKYGMTQWYWIARHRENLRLGENVEIGNFTVLGCEYDIYIQDNVKVGYGCVIMTDSTIDNKHGTVFLLKGCKIGANSVIMPDVMIGENATIGANSFVNCDIPPGETWAGTPARRIK